MKTSAEYRSLANTYFENAETIIAKIAFLKQNGCHSFDKKIILLNEVVLENRCTGNMLLKRAAEFSNKGN